MRRDVFGSTNRIVPASAPPLQAAEHRTLPSGLTIQIRPGLVESDRCVFGEEREIQIGGQNRDGEAFSDGAKEEISVRPLDAPLTTLIEDLGGMLEVAALDVEVGKGPEGITDSQKVSLKADPGKQLLAHGTDH